MVGGIDMTEKTFSFNFSSARHSPANSSYSPLTTFKSILFVIFKKDIGVRGIP